MELMFKNLDDLLKSKNKYVLYEAIAGSHAYGTNHAGSDKDIKGIFIFPATYYLLEVDPIKQFSDDKNDIVYYSLKRFIELASKANPNIIEMLWMPMDCELYRSPIVEKLFASREMFITKQAYDSHVNYARAQIKKAKGKNKWVNNPQPIDTPKREDFCWFIPLESNKPFRPQSLKTCKLNLNHFHVSAVEHSQSLYRLYEYGNKAKGVFRNGELVCESIPLEDEDLLCKGLLLFNEAAYECARRDHKNYWEWRSKRNETRWIGQEEGLRDYDAKNMLHTFRLLLSGKNILEKGEPTVRFKGEELRLLCDIRDGKFQYDELIQKVEIMLDELNSSYLNSNLPEEVDESKLKELLLNINELWEVRNK